MRLRISNLTRCMLARLTVKALSATVLAAILLTPDVRAQSQKAEYLDYIRKAAEQGERDYDGIITNWKQSIDPNPLKSPIVAVRRQPCGLDYPLGSEFLAHACRRATHAGLNTHRPPPPAERASPRRAGATRVRSSRPPH